MKYIRTNYGVKYNSHLPFMLRLMIQSKNILIICLKRENRSTVDLTINMNKFMFQ